MHRLWQTDFVRSVVWMLAFAYTLRCVACTGGQAAEPLETQKPALEIRESCTLTEADLQRPLIIAASNITIDGAGVTLVGGHGDPKTYTGNGVSATGVSNVTIRNLKVRGWETGLKLTDCEGWTIESCDFSNNFHDPNFGWGENGRRGGIVLEKVRKSTLRNNRAHNVWDACVLFDSDENTLVGNDFCFTSNTCLKLWHSSGNDVRDNLLKYGIRKSPGEVHARDSTCVLIESGSNDNHFLRNDCTHGGDGIFVRVLNGWNSTGNRFIENDCSYANNNGFECWARDNQFYRNKANHCSYGFWLGGSDHTVLVGNEASFNGLADGNHNSPHLPNSGHAGIVFMFGPSSHTTAKKNICIGNNGAGIAVIGDLDSQGKKWKAFHWIIEENQLHDNRWGLYLQYADWIVVSANQFSKGQRTDGPKASAPSRSHNASNHPGNTEFDVFVGDGVSRLTVDHSPLAQSNAVEPLSSASNRLQIEGPSSASVGRKVKFELVIPSGLHAADIVWDFGDGGTASERVVNHTFTEPGFYRVGVNALSDSGNELAWRDFYVVQDVDERGTEGDAARWSISDFHERTRSNNQVSQAVFSDIASDKLVGTSSLGVVIHPYAGFRAALTYPSTLNARWPSKGKSKLTFWLKAINEDVTGWQGGPFLMLQGNDGQRCYIEPKAGKDLMRETPDHEGKDGWRRMEIPFSGSDQWQVDGKVPEEIHAVTLAFDSWGAPTLRFWIDGLTIE